MPHRNAVTLLGASQSQRFCFFSGKEEYGPENETLLQASQSQRFCFFSGKEEYGPENETLL
jgi:hypothetical protein